MINNPSFFDKTKALTTLSDQVEQSTQDLLEKLASWNGYLVLKVSKKIGIIPEWAEQYLKLTRIFQREILAYKESHGELPKSVFKILSESKSALNDLVQELDPEKYLEMSSPEGQFVDAHSLLRKVHPTGHCISIAKCNDYWYQNLGLLMNVYFRSSDERVKKLVGFLVCNYLAKAAPVCPSAMFENKLAEETLYDLFQLPLDEPGISYNRESALFDSYFRDAVGDELSPSSGQLMFLTDTKNIQEVLPLSFQTVDYCKNCEKHDLVKQWSDAIFKKISIHFGKHKERSLDDFFSPPLLIDLTPLLEKDIYTKGLREKNQAFESKLRTIESWLELAVDNAIDPFCGPNDMRQKLKALVMINMTVICRCEFHEIGVLKILPVFFDPKYFIWQEGNAELLGIKQQTKPPLQFALALMDLKLTKSKVDIDNFLNGAGVRLGGVKGRMKVFDMLSPEQFLEVSSGTLVEYAMEGKNALYYEKGVDFLGKGIFKRFEELLEQGDEKPYLQLLGKGTIILLKGLFSEINEEKWNEINLHPELRELVQTALVKINLHLGMAMMDKRDFSKFTQWIELVHYEIAALLAIFTPFNKDCYQEISASVLENHIPKELQKFLSFGLSKSAMNTFAGISVSLRKNTDFPIRVYDPGSHFEIVEFIGENHEYEKVIHDDSIQIVDLYLGEFNHNVRLKRSHDAYTPGNIIEEVTALLLAKPKTLNLTVAIDSTIDFIRSSKASALLQHFSEDIRDGRLNMIFFRSGQKFDMLGMDHFYGSPWYMINNGESQWDSFNCLKTSDAFQADFLSLQWFCLAYKYAPVFLDAYRKAIFENTKAILAQVPKTLLPGGNELIKVCIVEGGMEPCFLDIKCYGDHPERVIRKLKSYIYNLFTGKNIKIHTRGGYGYFNPNVVLFLEGLDKDKGARYATLRLHPGINPEENALIVEFLKEAERMTL